MDNEVDTEQNAQNNFLRWTYGSDRLGTDTQDGMCLFKFIFGLQRTSLLGNQSSFCLITVLSAFSGAGVHTPVSCVLLCNGQGAI